MGNNVNLVQLLGLPPEIVCPRCMKGMDSHFDDYDIDCGTPQAAFNKGELTLDCYCPSCEHEWQRRFRISEPHRTDPTKKALAEALKWHRDYPQCTCGDNPHPGILNFECSCGFSAKFKAMNEALRLYESEGK